MANSFSPDILIQAPDPIAAASFYVKQLGFQIDEQSPDMISLRGSNLSLFIEAGPTLGPVLEVTVGDVDAAKKRLVEAGCIVVKDEPEIPRCYLKDPFRLIYNLNS